MIGSVKRRAHEILARHPGPSAASGLAVAAVSATTAGRTTASTGRRVGAGRGDREPHAEDPLAPGLAGPRVA